MGGRAGRASTRNGEAARLPSAGVMLRRLRQSSCSRPPSPRRAQPPRRRELMPGVTYEQTVQFTPHGPVVLHVITAPRPGDRRPLPTRPGARAAARSPAAASA